MARTRDFKNSVLRLARAKNYYTQLEADVHLYDESTDAYPPSAREFKYSVTFVELDSIYSLARASDHDCTALNQYGAVLTDHEGTTAYAVLGGQCNSSTSAEALGAILAVCMPGPAHVGIDNQSCLNALSQLLYLAHHVPPNLCPDSDAFRPKNVLHRAIPQTMGPSAQRSALEAFVWVHRRENAEGHPGNKSQRPRH